MNSLNNPLIKKTEVKIFENRDSLGACSCADVTKKVKELLSQKDTINMVFAAAPSQADFLNRFCEEKSIDFSRINAFHMDEYIGLKEGAPQGFGEFLNRYLFKKVNFKAVHYLNGNAAEIDEECLRYEKLLKENPPDIICLGIGENGHIAFNDPGFAEFDDKRLVKIVELDMVCRQQQVNDKCFETIDEVPKRAITLTVPALTNSPFHFCIVPAITKAQAVKNTLYGEVSENCPATALRKCSNVIFYFDKLAASLL